MGANINDIENLQKIDVTMNKVLNNLKSWDGTLEYGISIIEYNAAHFEELKALNLLLNQDLITYGEKYREKINQVLTEQKKLTKSLKMEQDKLLISMGQLNKRDDVINSYISVKNYPIFIDKDVI